MPELPEVETTVKSLNILKNKKVIKVDVHTKKLRYPVPLKPLKQILNSKIINLRRIAKYVIIDFDNLNSILIHLGMSGRLKILKNKTLITNKTLKTGPLESSGKGLESQSEWEITGEALVTDVPITFLGFVNRETGTIEEEGHPLDGISMANKILIFPKGSGSTVAPYVLLGLFYNGNGPKAIINTDLDQQTIPACSLLAVPYAHSFEDNPCLEINSGDKINLALKDDNVSLSCLLYTSDAADE